MFKKQKTLLKKQRSTNMRNFTYYVVIVSLLVVSFIGLQLNVAKYKRTVDVVALKSDIGTGIITTSDITQLTLSQNDYTKDMILWKDRDKEVINKYPLMIIRKNTPVYKDMLTSQPKVRYSYLYTMSPNQELLTFKYDNSMAGGRIPRPGDHFRIRGSYKLSDQEKQSLLASGYKNVVPGDFNSLSGNNIIVGDIRTSIIFNDVLVVDMLNSNGDSIYEIWNRYNNMSKVEQQKLLEDNNFKQSVTPTSLLLIVNSDDVNKYVEFAAASNAQYTLTLLKRDDSMKNDDLKSEGPPLMNTNSVTESPSSSK